jgi:hypothetical protein
MANEPKPSATVKISDRPHAPVIFFDEAPIFNNYNGIIGVTLSVNLSLPNGRGGLISEQVVAGYLRGNVKALTALRGAIDSALLLGTKIEGEAN